MIVGNDAMMHVDGGEYIRVACLGQLQAIAEEKGMGLEAREIMEDSIRELHDRLKTQLQKELIKAWTWPDPVTETGRTVSEQAAWDAKHADYNYEESKLTIAELANVDPKLLKQYQHGILTGGELDRIVREG
jgi:hypothetical protein